MMLKFSQDLRGPHQPADFKFPVTTFGNNQSARQRSFQPAWFDRYKWLHYEEKSDSAFCYTCIKAVQNNMISSSKADLAFTEKGFRNWKNATDKKKGFQKHETSDAHREVVSRYATAPATASGDVGELISEQHYLEKFKNRKVLLMMLRSNVRYLARQSLPLGGNWDESSKAEGNCNFHQLIKLRSEQDPEILEWLQRKSNKYTSPVIQNEMLEAVALGLLREISANIQGATFYTIMADETADISNKEQLIICIRWVDENFVVHEDFLGIHPLEQTTADDIVFIMKDVLLRMYLKIQNARSQCYDGAATMAGKRKGVATQIKAINRKCLYTHCYGHA